jgi:NADH-quinone oxidoreductase subunit J
MTIALVVLAFIAIVSGLGVAFSRDAVHSALNLTVNLLTVAVLYLTMGLQFLGMAQLLIYAGAIMVVFLFAVTVLAPDEEQGLNHPNAKLIAGVCVGSLIGACLVVTMRLGIAHQSIENNSPGTVHAFATNLFGKYAFPFEVTAFLLLVALIGSVLLGHKRLRAAGIPTQPPTPLKSPPNLAHTPPPLEGTLGVGPEDLRHA